MMIFNETQMGKYLDLFFCSVLLVSLVSNKIQRVYNSDK